MTKTDTYKKAMMEAMRASLGIVSEAAEIAGIARATHYEWMKEDSAYRAEIESISDMAIDFAESALKKKIESGDTTAIIFYLKTKGKRRGFIEKIETEQSGSLTNINVTVDSGETADELRKLINSK